MKPRTWFGIVLFCLAAAMVALFHGTRRAPRPATTASTRHIRTGNPAPSLTPSLHLLTRLSPNAPSPGTASHRPAVLTATHTLNYPDPKYPWRLRNTPLPLGKLTRMNSAILLRNALIDTAAGGLPAIPPQLQAHGDPGSYIVQARGALTEGFRREVIQSGAQVVSYIPNDAYLVRATADAASRLRALTTTRDVLPYQPYYKLDPLLLPAAIQQTALPGNTRLRVTIFPGERVTATAALKQLGAQIDGTGSSPFGPQLIVTTPPKALVAMAALPSVQLLEPFAPRVFLNDLTRMRLGVSADTTSSNNYLGLTGSNVWVNINDSGVDAQNPDLKGRVFGDTSAVLTDPVGHGTYVAGTIASSGENGPDGTNAPGSVAGANFRGMAPAAKLFAMQVNQVTGPAVSDNYLQETAALTNYTTLGRTNAMVSNNSWGYPGEYDYNSVAASYDAATRDALPRVSGMQGMLYVFAAGNDGAGNDVGTGGQPGTILSPATAKDVITVGALESPRDITNEVTYTVNGQPVTNTVFLGQTDSSDEVTSFSSRGNVGIGEEGAYGRFKPDLVAPGAFVVSTRAQGWSADFGATNVNINLFTNQVVDPFTTNEYSVYVPPNATELVIEVQTNLLSPSPFPQLPMAISQNPGAATPTTTGNNRLVLDSPAEGTWYYTIASREFAPVIFDLQVTAKTSQPYGDYYNVLQDLNDPLKPYYRFGSGTSSAAASVSGMLALIQEFFEQDLKRPYSPALLKALLINGARSVGTLYSFEVRNQINYQGWGMPNLPDTLPTDLTNATQLTNSPIQWVDQSPTNALATGQLHRYAVTLSTNALSADLRVTLVWTDPPGNPAASTKLVNNLDLIVSNSVTHVIYAGNDIRAGSSYTHAGTTNDPPVFDDINNVENVFLPAPLDTNYVVEVYGRRVNVNADTANPNGIVQDYALVVSTTSTNALSLTEEAPLTATGTNFVSGPTTITNGIPLLNQLVGANSPLQDYPIGLTNQWHFYTFTNSMMPGSTLTNGPYVAFVTFVPPNLSVPRNLEADIDLYVTRGDPGLLELNPLSVADAYKSVGRGGSEVVSFTNATQGEVFYVGVKSEDQMASEYGLVGLSSQEPFSSIDQNGNYHLRGLNLPTPIPDGSAAHPGGAYVFAISPNPISIGNVVVEQDLVHQEIGDLSGNLSHGQTFVVLNNHSVLPQRTNGIYSAVYDDSGSGELPNSLPSDGPGSLLDFLGTQGSGAWMLTEVDNAPGHTGYVQNIDIRLTPAPDLLAGTFGSVLANQFHYYFIDVPADASRMRVLLTQMTGPLNLYVRRVYPPTLTDYDKAAFLTPPSGELDVGIQDVPPLTAGRYFIGVYNPTALTQQYFLRVVLERDLPSSYKAELASTNEIGIGDDVLTVQTNVVADNMVVTGVKVGIVADSPRLSDLAFYLVSPTGQKVLLDENRGGTNWTQLGYQTVVTNYYHVALTYSTNSGQAVLYVNGVPQIEKDVGMFHPATAANLYLGRLPTTNAPAQFLGLLDDVDVYRRALAPSEILGIAKFGAAGKPLDGLVSHWPFDGSGADTQGNNPADVVGPTYVAGKFGQALKFTTNGDLVLVTNTGSLNLANAPGLTLDAWISPTDLSQKRPIAVWSDGTNYSTVEFGVRPVSTNNVGGVLYADLVDTTGSNHVILAPLPPSVVPAAPKLANPVPLPSADQFQKLGLTLIGTPGADFSIEATTNYTGWTSVYSGTLTMATQQVTVPVVTNQTFRVYRARYDASTGGGTGVAVPAGSGVLLPNSVTTNYVYTTFTDDTNLALVPIKFGTPATNADTPLTDQLVSGFEDVTATNVTNFVTGDTFDGWTVTAGQPAVLRSTYLAHTGTNLLVLRDGALKRTLPTVAGHFYRLDFVTRQQPSPSGIVAWWPGDGNFQDLMSTNVAQVVGDVGFTNAEVGDGFLFRPNQGYLEVPDSPALELTRQLSVELWFRLDGPPFSPVGLFAKRADPQGISSLAANYGADISSRGLELWYNDTNYTSSLSDDPTSGYELLRVTPMPTLNQFHHMVGTFQQISPDQVEMQLYLDGELRRSLVLPGTLTDTVNSSPLLLGASQAGKDDFNGVLDEITLYNRVLSPDEVASLYALDRVGKGQPPNLAQTQIVLDNATTNTFGSGADWSTNSVTFQAATNGTELDLTSLQPGAMFDSFELVELPATYFQPEEPLTPLLGQPASGNWTLQVLDRRVGATNPPPVLVSWDLQLTFAPKAVNALPLENGITFSNSIPANSVQYFYVDVPRSASFATNTLTATTGLDLWYNPNGVPEFGQQSDDFALLTNSTLGIAVLATNGYYQVDTNGVPLFSAFSPPQLIPGQRYYLAVTNSLATTDYSIRVDFDKLDTNVIGVTPLAYGQTISTNIAVTNALQYYRYTVSTNAVSAAFEVIPKDGNVNLYIRKATPVADPLPTPRQYDYASENPGTNAEVIVVNQDSIVPLGSGDWYLGVLNVDTNLVHYSVRVVETNAPPPITRLQENVPVTDTESTGDGNTHYFVFTVTNNVPAVQFDLYGLSGDATLLTQVGSKPTTSDFYAADPGTPVAPAKIVVRTNSVLPSLQGDWYLAAYNTGSSNLQFTIKASFPPEPAPVVHLLNGVGVRQTIAADTVGLAPALDYYDFTVPSGATQAVFTVTPLNGNVDMVVKAGLPLPDAFTYDYLSSNPGTQPEVLTLDPNSAPVPLAPGDWYIGVINQDIHSVTYTVEVTQLPNSGGGGGPGITIPPASIRYVGGVLTFSWSAPAGENFQVQYATSIPTNGPINWTAIPGGITYSNGVYQFTDDGSLSGGSAPFKMFRVVQLP